MRFKLFPKVSFQIGFFIDLGGTITGMLIAIPLLVIWIVVVLPEILRVNFGEHFFAGFTKFSEIGQTHFWLGFSAAPVGVNRCHS